MKVAIPRFQESVAPCFEYSATIAIFTIEEKRIVEQIDFPLRSKDPFDRVRLLKDQNVNTVICGGVRERYEDLLKTNGIQVISWASGPVESLLDLFMRGSLVPGKTQRSTGPDAMEESEQQS